MNRKDFLKLSAGAALTLCTKKIELLAHQLNPDKYLSRLVPPIRNTQILAPHYTWYTKEKWISGFETAYTNPLRGAYCSTDLEVIAAQNAEKRDYGIDDIVSWWGPGEKPYEMFKKGYLQVAKAEKRPFGFLYEISGRLPHMEEDGMFDFSKPENKQKFLDDIDYLEESYFNSAHYFRINRKPVLYLWWDAIDNFDEVRDCIKDRIFLIGSVRMDEPPTWTDTEKERRKLKSLNWYDAISQYGIGPVRAAKKFGFIADECIENFGKGILRWAEAIQLINPDVELIPPLQFAYHDNRGSVDSKDGKNRILYHDPVQSEKLTQLVSSLAKNLDCINRVMLVSYNEHLEGHGVEPSYEYGDFWLSLIKKYFKSETSLFFETEPEEIKLTNPGKERVIPKDK